MNNEERYKFRDHIPKKVAHHKESKFQFLTLPFFFIFHFYVDSNPMMENASKPQKALSHVNVFSRKLQRRLTRRTIAEAKALKHQSAETLQALIYLTKLVSM